MPHPTTHLADPPPPGPPAADSWAAGTPRSGSTPGPSAGSSTGTATMRSLVARVVVALAVATALSTDDLVATAERQPFGPSRDLALAAATLLDDRADALLLDRPAVAVRSLLGREPRTNGRDRPAEPAPRPAVEAEIADVAAGPLSTVRARPTTPTTTAPTTTAPGTTGPSRFDRPVAGISATPTPTTDPSDGGQPPRPVGPDDKLRIWAGGDSLGEYVGNQLAHPLTDPELVAVELDYQISTGLARPDYFDWPARIVERLTTGPPPDALVFMVGGNDNQSMRRDAETIGVGTDAWTVEYEARIVSLLDATDPAATHVYWIGLPPMRDGTRDEIAREVNATIERVAATRDNVSYLDLEPLLSGPEGGYSPHVTGPGGETRLARQADGVHITFAGSTWIAEIVWQQIRDRWALPPDGP